VRQHPRFFLLAFLAAIALRFLFIFRFPAITADSLVYGDIAGNWLRFGIFGLGGGTEITPTYVRLPGYPAFLAAVFAAFGMEHYRAVLFVQMFFDIGTCFLIAHMTLRLVSPAAARIAFLLAAVCPFLSNYAAAALTETLEIFFTALALDLGIAGLSHIDDPPSVRLWLACGLSVSAAILLRPDGGLLLIVIDLYLLARAVRSYRKFNPAPRRALLDCIRTVVVVALAALSPLVPWTLRNLRTFHRFEPLAPRYANEAGAFVPVGFNRWVKTWMADYSSVEEIYWAVPGNALDADKLPTRASDSPEQRETTEELFDDYNKLLRMTPGLDARFEALANERIHSAPSRYYLGLPLLRIADMWLRPRTEILPSDTRWWEFDDELKWSVLAVSLGLINLFYVLAALLGLLRVRCVDGLGLLLAFLLLRSLFLGTIENPEPRYTLECYLVLIVLAGAALAPLQSRVATDLRS